MGEAAGLGVQLEAAEAAAREATLTSEGLRAELFEATQAVEALRSQAGTELGLARESAAAEHCRAETEAAAREAIATTDGLRAELFEATQAMEALRAQAAAAEEQLVATVESAVGEALRSRKESIEDAAESAGWAAAAALAEAGAVGPVVGGALDRVVRAAEAAEARATAAEAEADRLRDLLSRSSLELVDASSGEVAISVDGEAVRGDDAAARGSSPLDPRGGLTISVVDEVGRRDAAVAVEAAERRAASAEAEAARLSREVMELTEQLQLSILGHKGAAELNRSKSRLLQLPWASSSSGRKSEQTSPLRISRGGALAAPLSLSNAASRAASAAASRSSSATPSAAGSEPATPLATPRSSFYSAAGPLSLAELGSQLKSARARAAEEAAQAEAARLTAALLREQLDDAERRLAQRGGGGAEGTEPGASV